MTKWNKQWSDNKKTEEYAKKPIKKENPKQIPEFENLYDRPQSSNSVEISQVGGIEGFHVNEYLEDVKKPKKMKKKSEEKDKKKNQENDVKQELERLMNRTGGVFSASGTDIDKSINSLSNNLEQSVDSLSQLQNINSSFSGMGNIDATKDASKPMEIDKGNLQKTLDSVTTSVKSVTNIITYLIGIMGKQLQIGRTKIQLFLLKSNKYVKETICRMANALTQNTATEVEVNIFQDQAQKFITLLLVWYFVYNWYYIIFFLEDDDNIRYKLEFGDLRKVSKYFYGFFGPALKPLELLNKGITSLSIVKTHKKYGLYTGVIMIIMFFIFYVLVEYNFQTALLQDFFAAINGTSTISVLSICNILVVIIFATMWFFGGMDDGNLEMSKLLLDGMKGGVWTLFFSIVMFVLAFIGYYMWIVAVNVPMSMVMLTGYLVLYTFCGVLFYEGFNMFNIYAGISESLETASPDLTEEPCKPNSPFLTFMWFKETFAWILDTLNRLVSFFSTNMFEVIILLTLIGGLGVYRSEWSNAMEGKAGIGVSSATNLSSVFKNLFAWLIIINILLIVFFGMFLYNKWKLLSDMNTMMKGDISMSNQTARSRMASARGDKSAPVISRSKTEALKQKLEKFETKEEDTNEESTETKEENANEEPTETKEENTKKEPTETKEEDTNEESSETKEEDTNEESTETKEENMNEESTETKEEK